MIYVDEVADYGKMIGGYGPCWAHLGTDDHTPEGVEILHSFARRLGLKRAWFQNKPHAPHYDLTVRKQAQALRLGAQLATRPEWLRFCAPVLWERTRAGGVVSLSDGEGSGVAGTQRDRPTAKQASGSVGNRGQ